MYVILTYDVNKKRSKKIMEICQRYLVHVQRSVLEGTITEGKLKKLKNELSSSLNPSEDSCSIYITTNYQYLNKQTIGKAIFQSNILCYQETGLTEQKTMLKDEETTKG